MVPRYRFKLHQMLPIQTATQYRRKVISKGTNCYFFCLEWGRISCTWHPEPTTRLNYRENNLSPEKTTSTVAGHLIKPHLIGRDKKVNEHMGWQKRHRAGIRKFPQPSGTKNGFKVHNEWMFCSVSAVPQTLQLAECSTHLRTEP